MSTNIPTQNAPSTTSKPPARKFRELATQIAGSMLRDWVGEERAGEATGRISAALAASAAAARNPQDFYECTPQSIGQCIAVAALTEIMPGTGATALAYLIPRRPRKGEQPQLQFQFSHRGLNALARRSGQTMIAIPISFRDELQVNEDGDVRVTNRDIDHPPSSQKELRGVIIAVKEIANGNTIYRGWVPVSVINIRRDKSDSYQFALRNDWAKATDPWHCWPVEMSMKAAMHYAISRGWCVIDDAAATRALSAEQAQDLRIVSRDPVPGIEDQRSASDELASQLGVDVPQETDTVSETASEANPASDKGKSRKGKGKGGKKKDRPASEEKSKPQPDKSIFERLQEDITQATIPEVVDEIRKQAVMDAQQNRISAEELQFLRDLCETRKETLAGEPADV